jgi:hypothetical protein
MPPEFRAGERVISVKLYCTECGGRAQGNASWTDGSGEICDACVERDREVSREQTAAEHTAGTR